MTTKLAGPAFRKGDEVVLAEGTYQGTPGIFLRLREDLNWADVTESDGTIRAHPVVWLAHRSTSTRIDASEDECEAYPCPTAIGAISMSGTPARVDRAEHIKLRVNEEFDRVAASLKSIADSQNGDHRADTEAMINILEEKRAEVMSRNQAGYFLNNWQEISDQVRRIVYEDARCVAIQSKDAA